MIVITSMKINKLLLFLLAMIGFMLSACSKDDSNESGGDKPANFTVSVTELSFDATGGQTDFSIEGGQPYVRSEAGWLALSKSSATPKKVVYHAVCSANDTKQERSTTITINLNGVNKNITVKQAAPAKEPEKEPEKEHTFRTASLVGKDMYPGWNLGNTLEACDPNNLFKNNGGLGSETSWQQTKTTQQVIDAVRDAGFKSVRIPVAWACGHISGGTEAAPIIDQVWMNRVKEIVDYCIKDGLYVVLNDHWDGGWLEVLGFSKKSDSYSAVSDEWANGKIETLKYLWTQIANQFKNYDEHLLFAGLNEPFQEYGLFNGKHDKLAPYLIKYNKAFVEAVRATGGNNANRILVVQGPSTSIDSSVSYMKANSLPESAGKLMVEVHYYDPGQFCGTWDATGDKAFYFWGSGNHGSDHNANYGEESYMKSQFEKLKKEYTSKGYPVIIGEYAANQRTISKDQAKHDASIKLFYKLVNEYGINNGIIPFAWDTNYPVGLKQEGGSSTIIDRSKCTVVGTNALEGIKAGVAAGVWGM